MTISELISLINDLEKSPIENRDLIIKYQAMLCEWERGLQESVGQKETHYLGSGWGVK